MLAPVRSLGFGSVRLLGELGRMGVFAAGVGRALLRRPWRFARLRQEVYDTGFLSVAIVCGSGLAVGAVLGLQGYNTLVRFGAEESLGAVVGLSLIRELGPVLTGLLVTGRAGSAMAAEIASMRASEQLDGLRMMSIDPIHLVVAPKALANTKRLDFAKNLIDGTDLPMTEIAYASGFASIRRFNDAVKKRYGVSPRELRPLDGAPPGQARGRRGRPADLSAEAPAKAGCFGGFRRLVHRRLGQGGSFHTLHGCPPFAAGAAPRRGSGP